MDAKLKSVLLEMVGDLSDLRTNLAVIAANVPHPPTSAAAQDAKTIAKKEHDATYEALRRKIEAL